VKYGLRSTAEQDLEVSKLYKILWTRIRKEIIELFPADEGIVPNEIPKSLKKWNYDTWILSQMVAEPVTTFKGLDWVHNVLDKSGGSVQFMHDYGTCTLKQDPNKRTAAIKQVNETLLQPDPVWTFLGGKTKWDEVKQQAEILNKSIQSNPDASPFMKRMEADALEKILTVPGGVNGLYALADIMRIPDGMLRVCDAEPIADLHTMEEAHVELMYEQFPAIAGRMGLLEPLHLVPVIGGNTKGAVVGNRQGSYGYPFTNSTREEADELLVEAGGKRAAGRPLNKGGALCYTLSQIRKWIDADMPDSGPVFEDVLNQPSAIFHRSDRTVELMVRKWAMRVPALAALFPSRTVIVVDGTSVFCQATWFQPLNRLIMSSAAPGYDWVHPTHTRARMSALIEADVTQAAAGDGFEVQTIGLDASGWDRSVTGWDHAWETAFYLDLFPREFDMITCDAPDPLKDGDDVIEMLNAEFDNSARTSIRKQVTLVSTQGTEYARYVRFWRKNIDYHHFITVVMSGVNGCDLALADLTVSQPVRKFRVPDPFKERGDQDYFITTRGGRSSGDGGTGTGNNHTNLLGMKISDTLSKRSQQDQPLQAARCKRMGIPYPQNITVADMFARGDDLAAVLVLPIGADGLAQGAGCLAMTGRIVNKDKQEGSGIAGIPEVGFATTYYDSVFLHGFKTALRVMLRTIFKERGGVPPPSQQDKDMIDALDLGDISEAMIETTLTIKARLMALWGDIVGLDAHPVRWEITDWVQDLDKELLVYAEAATSEQQFIAALTREAQRYASREAIRRGLSVSDMQKLQDDYVEASLTTYLRQRAMALAEGDRRAELDRVDVKTTFREWSRQPGGPPDWILEE